MPDHENTFVLRSLLPSVSDLEIDGSNFESGAPINGSAALDGTKGQELVFDAADAAEMKTWLNVIRACMSFPSAEARQLLLETLHKK